jgi:hypothetical protein
VLESKKSGGEDDVWGPLMGCWYGVRDLEDDECGKIGTEL